MRPARAPARLEFEAFLKDVVSEAGSDSGTWSLATCMRLRSLFPRLSPSDASLFIGEVVRIIVSPACKPLERYKLAQMCTAIHAMALPHAETFLRTCQVLIEQFYSQIDEAHLLGKPTIQLLQFLYKGAPNVRRGSAPGEGHHRRGSAALIPGPIYEVKPAFAPSSKTPDPRPMPAGKT
jgi:hypothetical protein